MRSASAAGRHFFGAGGPAGLVSIDFLLLVLCAVLVYRELRGKRARVGMWNIPVDYFGKAGAYNCTVYPVHDPSRLLRDLETLRQAGASCFLGVARSKSKDAAGELSVPTTYAYLASWPDITPYLASGTVLGVIVSDDITGKEIWGAGAPYFDRIDLIAKAVTDRWPRAFTVVRARATQLEAYSWKWLRGAWGQYSAIARDGKPEDYLRIEKASAARQGLRLVIGLNVQNGGDGSSGVPGTDSGRWQMSGAELRKYGKVFLPHTPALLGWTYGPSYTGSNLSLERRAQVQGFDARTDVRAAVEELLRGAA